MTKKAQDAYIMGFCKTAEAYGVDPRQLMKAAGWLDPVIGKGARYLELLRGGNKTILKDWNAAMDIAGHVKDPTIARDMVWHLQGATPNTYKKFFTTLPDGSKKLLFNTEEILTPEVTKELDKVFNTRASTGLAGTGLLGYGLYRGLKGEQK